MEIFACIAQKVLIHSYSTNNNKMMYSQLYINDYYLIFLTWQVLVWVGMMHQSGWSQVVLWWKVLAAHPVAFIQLRWLQPHDGRNAKNCFPFITPGMIWGNQADARKLLKCIHSYCIMINYERKCQTSVGVSLFWDCFFNTYLDIRLKQISLILLVSAK